MRDYRDLGGLIEIIEQERKKNKKIVFTNGCYDVIHRGHVHTLERASRLGDLLVVGLNSDKSIRKFKGDKRPVQTEEDRAYILTHIKGVDYVIIFDDDEPLELLKILEPDVLVKGGNPLPERVEKERKIVEHYGGRVVCLELIKGYSTTEIIKSIKS